MKKQRTLKNGSSVLLGAGMVLVSLSAYGQEAAENHPPLLIASYSQHAAYMVSTNGTVVWESCKMPGACQDAWLLPNNHVLLSGGNQVREITADKKTVWQYESPKGVAVQIHNCQPLPGGGALIGEGGTCRLLELDNAGKIAKEIKLSLRGNAHTHMRQVRKTPKGTYLVTAAGENNIREYDAQGKKVVWKFKNPAVGNPTHVKLLTPAEPDGFLKSAVK